MHKQNIPGKFGTMRLFNCLFLLVSMFLISCEKDPLNNCDCTLTTKGLLCKTYFFEYNECIGYVDYAYNNKLQRQTESFKTVKGKLKKVIASTYNDQGNIIETYVDIKSPAKTEKTTFTYNASNRIDKIEQFENEKLIKNKLFFYNESGQLEKSKIYNLGISDSIILYEYDTKGLLWRESSLNGDSIVSSYKIHLFYDNNIERVNLYNSNNAYLGYNLQIFNTMGNIISYLTYSRTNELTEKITYEYENNLLIKESKLNGFNQLISYTAHFYS